MSYYTDKRILITGIGLGLGRRMALAMARKGGRIIGWDINPDSMSQVMAELKMADGREHVGFVCDLADRQAVYQVAAQVREQVGNPDILINNAGVVTGKPILQCSDDEIEQTMKVNALSLFWTAKAFLPAMITRNAGHIVTVASAAGILGAAKLTDYSASKAAAIGFDDALRSELQAAAPGVKTTVICPYYINTGMFAGVKSRFPFLLPILDEQYAAARMVSAIENRRRCLIMPWIVSSVFILRLLPVDFLDRVADFLGIHISMDQFKGRKK